MVHLIPLRRAQGWIAHILKALARGFSWKKMLEEGDFQTLEEIAEADKINPSYVSRLLRMTLLAPEIVEAILAGRQPSGAKGVRTLGTPH